MGIQCPLAGGRSGVEHVARLGLQRLNMVPQCAAGILRRTVQPDP